MRLEAAAIVLHTLNTLPTLESVMVDDPGEDEVRVRMVASGICHTDIGYVRYARFTPVLLGHEGVGIVEAVGRRVTHVREGDSVVINWLAKCGQCLRCRAGQPDLCEKPLETSGSRLFWRGAPLGVMANAGTFCHYAVVPAKGAIPIRRDMPLQAAATLGCAVATGVGAVMRTAKVQPFETVVVIGTGGVGLNIIQGARLSNCSTIIAADIDDERLALARQFGATATINNRERDLVQAVRDLTGGRGADQVFEVVGLPELMRQGIDMLAWAGTLTLVGAAEREAVLSLHPRKFMASQYRMLGSVYGNVFPEVDFPAYADWYMSGRLLLDELHTEVVRLGDVPTVFARQQHSGVRTLIDFTDDLR